MKVEDFVSTLGSEFYAGVPDSQLKALCNYLLETYGTGKNHIITANEGNAVGLAAGYYMATGKVAVVYLQNSGNGNIINPVASLLHREVYGIPCIFVVGWRGEPGVKDEPQHRYQGKVTLQLLQDMEIETMIISKETTVEEVENQMQKFRQLLQQGKDVAFVVKKDALQYDGKITYQNSYPMRREEIISEILDASEKEDIFVSTTGKASRELFELRENRGESHDRDFLTVGSMGHSSSIALEIAMQKSERRVWCIDGDGAALMHLGAMGVIGTYAPRNLVHVLINNGAHESVGGMPTVAENMDFMQISRGCGYKYAVSAKTKEELRQELQIIREGKELCFLEVKAAVGARDDLGRPTGTPRQNRDIFMRKIISGK